MAGSIIEIILLIGAIVLIVPKNLPAAGKKIKSSTECEHNECFLSKSHFNLYRVVKSALDSGFDISGKDIIPLLRSVHILRRRFEIAGGGDIDGASRVRFLLANETLINAVTIFESNDGRELTNLYKSSTNERDQNLACSLIRIQDIERASARITYSPRLEWLFSKIHENFKRKSANRCARVSCKSVDYSMSKLDSVLRRSQLPEEERTRLEGENGNDTAVSIEKSRNNRDREFHFEELELCKFFKKTEDPGCEITAEELSQIHLFRQETDAPNDNQPTLQDIDEFLRSYRPSKPRAVTPATEDTWDDGPRQAIISACRPILSLLDYHLAGVKWYQEQNLFGKKSGIWRAPMCSSLNYWLQIDRLCREINALAVNTKQSKSSVRVSKDGPQNSI